MDEILVPLKEKKDVIYTPYSCSKKTYESSKVIQFKKLNIIEGVYSSHPLFDDIYDCKIFIDVSKEEQKCRIKKRCPDKYDKFLEKWIPLENYYFDYYRIRDKADYWLKF